MPASDDLPSYQFTPVCQRVQPEQRANITYELILRQQPKQSRMCGVGEKADRRPIDPPPIVQLIVKTPPSSGANKSGFTSYLQNPYYFMHASLVEKDSPQDVLLIKDTRSKEDMNTIFKDNRTKATTGSSVSSLYPLKDFEDSGTESGFFVFPDLSVRMEGTYRLKFSLYEMVGRDVHFCAHVISDPLVVYSAKKFPGMEESTLLSQYFAEQGLKIRIRKEVRPKKRSRGEYLTAPTSQSPTESQQRDPAESQDEDEPIAVADVPLASKRSASGTRGVETRREEAPATPQRDSIQVNHPERRPSQGNKPASRRGQVQEYAGYQIMPVAVDRPRSTPDSYPQQQGYFEDTSLGPRRFSAANKTVESVSHMDLDAGLSVVSGERPEQWAGEYRVRTLDQAPAAQERRISSPSLSRQGPLVTYRGPSAMARAPPIQPTSGAEMQMSDQRALNSPTLKPNAGPTGVQDISGSYEGGVPTGPPYVRHNGGSLSEYREEARRGSGVGSRRDSGLESPVVYDSRGAAGPPRHQRDHPPAPPYPAEDSLRIAHAQPFTARTTPPETPYAYPSRQGYTGSNTQRSVDYGAPTHYPEDHHRSSVSSNPYDRSDYTTRPQVDAPSQHTVPFHPPAQLSQHSSYASREQQQPAPRSRPTSHHDLYSEYQQQAVPHSQPPSHAKYAAPNGTDLSHMFQEVEHSAVVKYPSGLASGDDPLPVHGRYASHGHPSYPSTAREEPAALRRESLVTSPPRPQDYRSQSIPQFASTGSGSAPPKTYPHSSGENIPTGGYDSFHQERESDNGSRYPNHGSSGFPAHSDSSPPSAVGPESNGQYNRGGNPTTVPYSTHHQEPVSGMVHGEVLRQAPIEYGHEHRPPYGHGRTMSSLSIHRPSYTPTSAPMPAGHPLGSGMRASNPSVSAAGPTQGRGAGRYDGYESSQGSAHGPHYTTAHPVNHGSAPDPYGAYVGGGGGGGGGGGRTSEHVYEHSAGHVPQPPPPHYPHSQQQQPPPQQPPPPPMQQVQHPHQHQHPQYHTPVPPPHHQYQHYPEPPPLNHGPPPPSQHQHQAHPHAQTHIHAHVRAQGHVLGPAQIQAAQQHGHSHAPLYPMQPQAGGPHGYGYGPSTVTHGEEAGRSRS